eukprot:TRINITY_DN13150_c0_g1_i1.p1 TRINITY_DN13150_c0_g1~~TRINITY_DN13150_c0_g1_i1.p1  ORF type:complete len:246 (-),score=30.29 TRINITY_DN13150_c0_g1_i1:49-786(-)
MDNTKPCNAGEEFRLFVSVDLYCTAEKIIRFLGQCATHKNKFYGVPTVYNGYIDTYLNFISLKAKYPNARLIPSLEVEWIWYSHLLRPKLYETFCMKSFDYIIPHSLDDWLEGHEDPGSIVETAELYEKEYGSKYICEETVSNSEIKYLETADLFNDWPWYSRLQQHPDYHSEEFLKEARSGYYKFLDGISRNGLRLGPPVDIDLFWHSHQISPQQYRTDCDRMFGEVIYHTPIGTVAGWDFRVS